ncbi:MAG: hypothetical protein ACXWO3_13280, partial [Isosphaeraceae bacterium]
SAPIRQRAATDWHQGVPELYGLIIRRRLGRCTGASAGKPLDHESGEQTADTRNQVTTGAEGTMLSAGSTW